MTSKTVDEWIDELSQDERIQSEAQIRATWIAAQRAITNIPPQESTEKPTPRFNIYSAADILNRKRPELVVIQDGLFVFIGQHYDIDIERVKSRAHVVEWLHHLMGKAWTTTETLEQFLEKACHHIGVKIYDR